VSATTVRRCLAESAIKPWQYRSWIFPRDPDFDNATAEPCGWRFTYKSLDRHLAKIAAHESRAASPPTNSR
jgi:hypothetical protein